MDLHEKFNFLGSTQNSAFEYKHVFLILLFITYMWCVAGTYVLNFKTEIIVGFLCLINNETLRLGQILKHRMMFRHKDPRAALITHVQLLGAWSLTIYTSFVLFLMNNNSTAILSFASWTTDKETLLFHSNKRLAQSVLQLSNTILFCDMTSLITDLNIIHQKHIHTTVVCFTFNATLSILFSPHVQEEIFCKSALPQCKIVKGP